MQVIKVNPAEYPNWDQHIQRMEGATVFHTAEWARVLSETYGYKPIYFVAYDDNRIVGCLPIMGIKTCFTKSRGVSLPFTDECSAICSSSNYFDSIWQHAKMHGNENKWKFIELRGEQPAYETAPAYDTFLVHTLDLDGNEDNLRSSLRNSTNRNVKKAIKSGLEIERSYSLESMKSFYKLNCMTRKKHGLPPQPLKFFLKVHEHIIKKRMGFVLSAIYNGMVVAAAVFFQFQNKMFYKYGASNANYQQLRANNLLMWEAIIYASQNGLRQFHFGRTEVGNSGLLQFKRGWGAREISRYYYRYDLAGCKFFSTSPKLKSSYAALSFMPIPLLKLFGRIMYRHVG